MHRPLFRAPVVALVGIIVWTVIASAQAGSALDGPATTAPVPVRLSPATAALADGDDVRARFLADGEAPASVLLRFQDARNRGDMESAMSLVASDLVYVGGPTCPPESPCVGTEALRHDLEQFSADQEYSSSAAGPDVTGTTVRVRFSLQSPGRSAIGLERTLADVTATVQDGQLTSWRSVSVWTDPQTAWWLDHQSAPQP